MSSDHPNGAPGDAPNTPHPGESAYPHTPPPHPTPGEPAPAEDDSTTRGTPSTNPQPTTPFEWQSPISPAPGGEFGALPADQQPPLPFGAAAAQDSPAGESHSGTPRTGPQATTPFGREPSTPAAQFGAPPSGTHPTLPFGEAAGHEGPSAGSGDLAFGGPQLTNPFAEESPRAGGYQPTLAYPSGAEPDLPGSGFGTPAGGFGTPMFGAAQDNPAEHGGPGSEAPHHLGVPPLGYPPAFEMPVPTVESANAMPGVEDAPPRRGKIEVQEAGVTRPRPPTVAEARAREKARKRAEEQALAEAEAAETKRRNRKKLLIGGGAIVGVAALVGAGYLAYDAWNGPEVTAYCTVVAKQGEQVPIGNGQTVTATSDNQEIVVPDNYCSDAENHGSGINPGFFFLAGHSYRYYYGGTGSIGHAPTGGSISAPSGATIKTKSGSTIQRGGLGARLHGGS
ncbi:hypothetical protein [Nocardia sp. NPDC020380]|uniref:hypothetical protein n=1 Tax=Nocardia sp. NPDC020380 TaxID=3364309 RepID=UPI003794077B